MKTQWPVLSSRPNEKELLDFLREVTRLRQIEDLPDFTNLNSQFVSGRSTSRIPSGASDVQQGDTLGDVVYALDGSFMYILVDVSGTPTWGRIAIDTTW